VKALRWDGEALRLEPEHPEPSIDPQQDALVQVRMAGICSTDLQILAGYMGFTGVLGHEFVGDVLEGPPEWRGRRVVGEINFACGRCERCAQGLGRHCATRQVLGILNADGCFAERVRVPLANLHAVPDAVRDEQAVFTEPLAAAFEIPEQVHLTPGCRAVVLGDGKLGLLIAQVLRRCGARVEVVGRHPAKLERVARLGIQTRLADAPLEGGADLVVEATGSAAGLRRAMELVRPRGTLVLKSTVAAEHALSLAPLVIDEITVVGSRCGPFAPALAALAAGDIDVEPLIEATYPLAEGLEAVEHARRKGAAKVLLRMPGLA
jgi:threonine dehydrogenase-like Zn-dependent dehydrogenase